MPVQFARPDVAALLVRVYDCVLHPEFFDCHRLATLDCGPLRINLRLCSAGHLLTFRCEQLALSEAIAEKNQSLPDRHNVLEQKVRGCRTRTVLLPNGWRYSIGCQLEMLAPELFLRVHEELRGDCAKAQLAHEFPSPNRFSPGALSLITAAVAHGSVALHAFHTFPDHCAIIKTQTLVEWD